MEMKSTTILVLLISLNLHIVFGSQQKCDRVPEGSPAKKLPPDGRFRLRIENDIIRYSPGENYTSK